MSKLWRKFPASADPTGQPAAAVPAIGRASWRRPLEMVDTEYSVYIVRCADDTYYTGIAADVGRRISEHENGRRGAKYLQGRGPLQLLFSEVIGTRSMALRLEYRVKQLSRGDKEALVDGRTSLSDLLEDQRSAAG